MAPIIYQDMRQNVHYDFPDKQLANDSYTHNLIKLLKTANLDKELNKDAVTDKDKGILKWLEKYW